MDIDKLNNKATGEAPVDKVIHFHTAETIFRGSSSGEATLEIVGWFGYHETTYAATPEGGREPFVSISELNPRDGFAKFVFTESMLMQFMPGIKMAEISQRIASELVMQLLERYIGRIPSPPKPRAQPSIEDPGHTREFEHSVAPKPIPAVPNPFVVEDSREYLKQFDLGLSDFNHDDITEDRDTFESFEDL